MKKYSRLSSAAIVIGALRVKLLLLHCFFNVQGKHLRSCQDGQLT